MIVYQILNKVNGHRYIGITKRSLSVRRYEHFKHARRGNPFKICMAIRKHGESEFEFSILETCESYMELNEAEKKWISLLKPEYNSTKGGDGILGMHMTEESRAKMRASKLSKPTRFWLGKKRSHETIEKIRATKLAANKPPHLTEKSLQQKLTNVAKFHERQKKKVICLTDGKIFSSGIEAAKYYNIDQPAVSAICHGKMFSKMGLKFKFLEGSGNGVH